MNVLTTRDADEIFASLDPATARALAEKFGTPVYLISEPALRGRVRALTAAAARYPNTRIAWSLKTNPLLGILEIMRSEGLWVEVVSDFEYSLVRKAGVPHEEIVSNGPARSDDVLVESLRGGAIVNLDHPEELERMIELGPRIGTDVPVGLRVDIDGTRRFGFSLQRGELQAAAQRLQETPHLRLGGLHNQLGARLRDLDRFRAFGECFASLAHELGAPLPWLDMGGSLAGTNPRGEESVRRHPWIDPADYCDALLSPLAGCADMLLLEPGRTLIEPAGALLTQVVSTRPSIDGSPAYVLNAGVNAVPTPERQRHTIRALVDDGPRTSASLYGPLCMNKDRLAENIPLPELRRGDLVLVEGVGAYDMPRAISFIEPRPGAVLWRGGDDGKWLRRPETLEQFQALER